MVGNAMHCSPKPEIADNRTSKWVMGRCERRSKSVSVVPYKVHLRKLVNLATCQGCCGWKMQELDLTEAADAQRPANLAAEVCHVCQTIGASKLLKCARCEGVLYCGRGCQLEDWRLGGHKQRCGQQDGQAAVARAKAKQAALDCAKAMLEEATITLDTVHFKRWRTEPTKDIHLLAGLMQLDLTPVGNERIDLIREFMRIGRERVLVAIGDRKKKTFTHHDVRDRIVAIGQRLADIGGDLQWVLDCDALSFPEVNRQELFEVWSTIRPLCPRPPRMNLAFK